MNKKKILFLTGTRADFGKLKPLINKVQNSQNYEFYIFVTGMHTLTRYGNTVDEVYKSFSDERRDGGFRNIFVFRNQIYGEPMEHVLANTVQGLSRFVCEVIPDLIVVHGDRVEALAGAIVGSLRNTLVAHVEGGEISGTIDELIRHSTSKMSHVHFVSNENAKRRLFQLGEAQNSVFVIGSPDIDLMLSEELPPLSTVKSHYTIPFENFGVVIFHPVTTDLDSTKADVTELVKAIKKSPDQNFVIIYPNNDEGTDLILTEYKKLKKDMNVRLMPSMRIEYFLSLLKNCDFILGNSSAGIMEAPVYGIKTINITHRQKNRHQSSSIFNISECTSENIISCMKEIKDLPKFAPDYSFGKGNSAEKFLECLDSGLVWEIAKQKQFIDL